MKHGEVILPNADLVQKVAQHICTISWIPIDIILSITIPFLLLFVLLVFILPLPSLTLVSNTPHSPKICIAALLIDIPAIQD